MSETHVALLGDSTFDSRPYLHGQPDMAARLARDARCRATLLAISGSRLADVTRQISRIPADATHIVVSAGGNDLLDSVRRIRGGNANLMQQLSQAAGLLSGFQREYGKTCKEMAAKGLVAAACTIYQPLVDDSVLRQLGAAALSRANITIEREARSCGLEVVDLREACRDAADFVDPIHPSARGADKIAAALSRWLQNAQAGV